MGTTECADFSPRGGVTCDVTAIAVAAAAVYSFHHVTCAHDSHALMQSRVAAVGAEHSSLACLFTQKEALLLLWG